MQEGHCDAQKLNVRARVHNMCAGPHVRIYGLVSVQVCI